jgi:hypothetical protein
MDAENLVFSEILLLDVMHIARVKSMQKSRFLLLTTTKIICHFHSTNQIPVQWWEIQTVYTSVSQIFSWRNPQNDFFFFFWIGTCENENKICRELVKHKDYKISRDILSDIRNFARYFKIVIYLLVSLFITRFVAEPLAMPCGTRGGKLSFGQCSGVIHWMIWVQIKLSFSNEKQFTKCLNFNRQGFLTLWSYPARSTTLTGCPRLLIQCISSYPPYLVEVSLYATWECTMP